MSKFNLNDLLNNQSKAPTPKPTFEVVPIHIDNIIPSDKNKYGIRDIEEMADSIENFGLMHNGVVEPTENEGVYRLISGERRYRGYRLLVERGNDDYLYFPCKIEKSQNDVLSELQLIVANALARELTDYEKTYQAVRLKELLLKLRSSGHPFKGRMREIVAEMLDTSPAQIGRMESIDKNLVPELQEGFKEGNIGISKAYELSTLSTKQQKEVVDKKIADVPIAEIKAELDVKSLPRKQKPKPAQSKGEYVKIVRCKDCDFRNTPDCLMWYEFECGECGSKGQWTWETDDGFCSKGELREDENNG